MAWHVRDADIVVAAAGSPGIITPDMVRPGAAVLDVGRPKPPLPHNNRRHHHWRRPGEGQAWPSRVEICSAAARTMGEISRSQSAAPTCPLEVKTGAPTAFRPGSSSTTL